MAARNLGLRAVVLSAHDDPPEDATLAIVHLDLPGLIEHDLVGRLKARGVHTIGHAGHKEKELLDRGKALGVDEVVTNSTLVHRIDTYFAR